MSTDPNVKHGKGPGGGSSLTWLCGGALALNLFLVAGLMALLGATGLAFFWQKELVEVRLKDGDVYLGEVHGTDLAPSAEDGAGEPEVRFRLKVGNRDITGADFVWLSESDVEEKLRPPEAVALERIEWGNFYGKVDRITLDGEDLATGMDQAWPALLELIDVKEDERRAIERLETDEIGDVNYELEHLRLERKRIELEEGEGSPGEARLADIASREEALNRRYEVLAADLKERKSAFLAETLHLSSFAGETIEIPVGHVLRAFQPNSMGMAAKIALYLSRGWEFLTGNPRESNTEGGIFPAIFGTVMMVILMSIFAVPLGVLAAVYLREYSKQGLLVQMVRIAVNNLAGVPSIVFGIFGLGFFVYLVGGTIDQIFYPEALPAPTFGTGGILWASLTLALLTVPVVVVTAEEGLAAVPRAVREGSSALGATKFETTWRVVIPAAAPGILTGWILAISRAAGEVAPLMILGMVKLAPSLPLDLHAPFVHLQRKFMHLGFHIYDVGFQSPNVEATKPLVYATAFLLVTIVTIMNLIAIGIRSHLRKKYASSAF